MRSGKIKIIGKSAIDFLIAPKANCIACTSALGANASFLCPNCYAALSPLYQTFEGVKKICRLCGREISGLRCRCGGGPKGAYETFSAYHFEMPVSALVKSFKYKAVTNLSGWLADEMIKALKGEKEFDLITCVPMHPLRRIKRGFNQSEILAKIISKKLNIPYVSVLKRRRYTKRQATLSAVKSRTARAGAPTPTPPNCMSLASGASLRMFSPIPVRRRSSASGHQVPASDTDGR